MHFYGFIFIDLIMYFVQYILFHILSEISYESFIGSEKLKMAAKMPY